MAARAQSVTAAICMICFGDVTVRLGRLCAASLRSTGWRSEIVVLTDRLRDWPRDLDVTQRVISPRTVNIDPEAVFAGAEFDCRDAPDPTSPAPTVQALTPIVHRWLDLPRLDLAIYLDADVLALRDMHACVAELASLPRPVAVGRNVGTLKGTPASHAHLSWLERRRWKSRPCLNTGFFCFRPERLAMRILKEWEIEMHGHVEGDQAALPAIYLRHFSDAIQVLPYSYQSFAPMPRLWDGRVESLPNPASYLMHFRGAIRAPEMMVAYARTHLPGAVELCGGFDAE